MKNEKENRKMTAMSMGMKELMIKKSEPVTGARETLSEFLMRRMNEDKDRNKNVVRNIHFNA